jgi:two-component system phosphate regulon response regulator OmpR
VSLDPAHILVVDDDARLRELLREFLSEEGFRVTAAQSAEDARAKMGTLAFDLVVLDVMMPGESGITFAGHLSRTSRVPILMLTAMGEAEHRIQGLEAGADDYLPKPFEPRELVLRINSILRRAAPAAVSVAPASVRLGGFVFDLGREELTENGALVALTSAERRLLKTLAERPGEVFSRTDLAQLLSTGGERTVDVQVNRLRRKIEPDQRLPKYLQTVRGQGYILRPD